MSDAPAEEGTRWTVLVAEDDAGVNQLIRKRLQRGGFVCAEAGNGAVALAMAREIPRGLILLLDYRLPDMDAAQVVNRLREEGREPPFIILTGEGDERTAVEMMKLGARDYLVKEGDFLERLPGVVERLLRELATEYALRLMREELAASEEKHRLLFESMAQGVIFRDAAGRIQAVNPAAERMLGVPSGDLMGKVHLDPCLHAIHEDGSPLSQEEMPALQALAGGKAVTGVVVGFRTRSESEPRWMVINATPQFRPGDSRPFQVFSTFTEITERVRMERHLRQARKLEAIGTLSGGIAHDFNNILGIMLGLAELIGLEAGDNPGIQRKVAQIIKTGLRGRDVVSQLLTFSRQSESAPHLLDPVPLIKETLKLLRSSLPATIDLVPRIDVTSVLMVADPAQVRQVVMNLCGNAAQAMGARGGRLEVALSEVTLNRDEQSRLTLAKGEHPLYRENQTTTFTVSPGRYICLSVSDTGPGFADGLEERIFDPFYTSRGVGSGGGLGLSVVHGIVTGCGGAVYASTKEGEGTQVVAYFPSYARQEEALPAALEQEAGSKKGRILVVDDEPDLAVVLERGLTQFGHQVVALTDPTQAWERFQSDPEGIDLLITDQTMPHMTGLDLVRRVRVLRPELPVILCTGHSDHAAQQWRVEGGIQASFDKPLSLRRLQAAVHAILSGRGDGGGE